LLLTSLEQCLTGSFVGMTAFEIVAKARIGKFKQNILFLSVKVLIFAKL